MNIKNLEQLKEDFLSKKISYKDVDAYFDSKSNTRSWHSREWKAKRKDFITDKSKCEQCGSKTLLLIQHFSHPHSLSQCYSIFYRGYYYKYKTALTNGNIIVSEEDIINEFNRSYTQVQKDLCPKCNSMNIKPRKTITPKYKCYKCSYEFANPISKLIPELSDIDLTPTQQGSNKILVSKPWLIRKITKSKFREYIKDRFNNEIETKAAIMCIDENIKYLNFEDTKIYCKKCAFMYDKLSLNICPICNTNFKSKYDDCCKSCLKIPSLL